MHYWHARWLESMGFYIPSSKVSGSRLHLINVVNADAQMSKAYTAKQKFFFGESKTNASTFSIKTLWWSITMKNYYVNSITHRTKEEAQSTSTSTWCCSAIHKSIYIALGRSFSSTYKNCKHTIFEWSQIFSSKPWVELLWSNLLHILTSFYALLTAIRLELSYMLPC